MNKILKRKLSKKKYLRITAMIVSMIMLFSNITILTAFKIDKDGEFNKGEHRTESIENLTFNATGTSSKFTIEADYYPWEEAGVSDISINSSRYILTSNIQVNYRQIDVNYPASIHSSTVRNNVKQAVLTHEFGHLFWLEDNPPSGSRKSIMNYGNDLSIYYGVQPYDYNNVRFIYD